VINLAEASADEVAVWSRSVSQTEERSDRGIVVAFFYRDRENNVVGIRGDGKPDVGGCRKRNFARWPQLGKQLSARLPHC
jgi:hypothetical protein